MSGQEWPQQDYLIKSITWPSKKLETPKGKEKGKTVLINYTTSNFTMKSGKVPTIVVDIMRLSY